MSVMINSKLQCAQTTCLPFVTITTRMILNCQLACLAATKCTAASYYSLTSNCALFTSIYNQNAYLVSELDTTTMIMISNSRFPPVSTILTTTNETVYSIWNTIAGGNSSASTAGDSSSDYYPGEEASKAFDKINTTKYTNYGNCNITASDTSCGLNTGVYLTLIRGSSCLQSIRFLTENTYPNRDPITITIEGSNSSSSALIYGSSWSLIYNGSTGLDTNPGRINFGIQQNITNSVWYLSYRILVTSKRGNETCASYAEIEITGY